MKNHELNNASVVATIIGNASNNMETAIKVVDLNKKIEDQIKALEMASNMPKALRKYQDKIAELQDDEKALKEYQENNKDLAQKFEAHTNKIDKLNKEEAKVEFEKFKLSEIKEYNFIPHLEGISVMGRQIGLVDFLNMSKVIVDFEK